MQPTQQRTILAAVATAEFLTTFMASSVFVASAVLTEDLHASAVTLSWISLAYILAVAALLMPAGKLADLMGRKRLFLTGMVVFSVFVLASAFARSSSALIAIRLFAGVGTAMVYSCTTALVALVYPAESRGRALGIMVSGTYLGLTLGPVLGGLIIDHLGWQWVFVVTGALGAVNCLVTWWGMRGLEWHEARSGRFDIAGSLAWAVALVALLIGISLLPDGLGIALVVLGALGLGAFILLEKRASDPILNLELFRNSRVFAFSNAAIFINYAATFAVPFVLTLYLELNRGLSGKMAGLLLVAAPAVQTLASPLAGRLADRVRPGLLAAGGLAVCVLGLASFAFVNDHTPRWYVVLMNGVLGLGFAFFSAPIIHSAMGSIERRYSSVASASIATMRMTGQNVSMGIATVVMAIFVGRNAMDADNPTDIANLLTSARVIFAILAGLCVFGVAAALVGPRKGETLAEGPPPGLR
jgi:EmrB/QacA subfamily drug resistance transporter